MNRLSPYVVLGRFEREGMRTAGLSVNGLIVSGVKRAAATATMSDGLSNCARRICPSSGDEALAHLKIQLFRQNSDVRGLNWKYLF